MRFRGDPFPLIQVALVLAALWIVLPTRITVALVVVYVPVVVLVRLGEVGERRGWW